MATSSMNQLLPCLILLLELLVDCQARPLGFQLQTGILAPMTAGSQALSKSTLLSTQNDNDDARSAGQSLNKMQMPRKGENVKRDVLDELDREGWVVDYTDALRDTDGVSLNVQGYRGGRMPPVGVHMCKSPLIKHEFVTMLPDEKHAILQNANDGDTKDVGDKERLGRVGTRGVQDAIRDMLDRESHETNFDVGTTAEPDRKECISVGVYRCKPTTARTSLCP